MSGGYSLLTSDKLRDGMLWGVTLLVLLSVFIHLQIYGLRYPFVEQWDLSLEIAQQVEAGNLPLRELVTTANGNHVHVWANISAALAAWLSNWNLQSEVTAVYLVILTTFVITLKSFVDENMRLSSLVVACLGVVLFSYSQRSVLLWGWVGMGWITLNLLFVVASVILATASPKVWKCFALIAVAIASIWTNTAGLTLPMLLPAFMWLLGYRNLLFYGLVWIPVVGFSVAAYIAANSVFAVVVSPLLASVVVLIVSLGLTVLLSHTVKQPLILLIPVIVILVALVAISLDGNNLSGIVETTLFIVTFYITSMSALVMGWSIDLPIVFPAFHVLLVIAAILSAALNVYWLVLEKQGRKVWPWVALAMFALGAVGITAVGRAESLWGGVVSRYTVLSAPLWISWIAISALGIQAISQNPRASLAPMLRVTNVGMLSLVFSLGFVNWVSYTLNPFQGVQLYTYDTREGETCFWSYLITEDETCVAFYAGNSRAVGRPQTAEFLDDYYTPRIGWLFEKRHTLYSAYAGVNPLTATLPPEYTQRDRVIVSGAEPKHHVQAVMASGNLVSVIHILNDRTGAASTLLDKSVSTPEALSDAVVGAERIWLLRASQTDDDQIIGPLIESCERFQIQNTDWRTTVYQDIQLLICEDVE
jgi:hypothetical protein